LPPPMLESAATLARISGFRTVLCAFVVMTEMVVITACVRNRREARFPCRWGRFSCPRGKHRARSRCRSRLGIGAN
jgi:hypothetical protein